MSTMAEQLNGRINVVTANGVYWGSRSTLVTTMSHISELKTEPEVLGSRRIADLTKDEADALWNWVRAASDLLASHVPSSVARNRPDGAEE
jgi:hypothetical protein